ncbi:MAG: hypothetical protein JWQ11_1392 [Rhizobacter sp.]|nr:hypothetical protein [Rhizobacter sp.]
MSSNPTSRPAPSNDWLEDARNQWHWRGQARPAFAAEPAAGQESVWDYPRPPAIALDSREVVIRWCGVEVARTRRAVRTLETSHPPSFYIPFDDVVDGLLHLDSGHSFCEWKGEARYWTLSNKGQRLTQVAWDYPQPLPGSEALAGHVAFYPAHLDCTVDGAVVSPQPGGFYGGWITPELVGPFKGAPGSSGW